ncbi:MAG TPA: type II secretion system protein GspM [Usitatibacteraceae bacterium]|nr:type II secretion system protein GspM [Usitatibacteraceae bacterium]
MNAPAFWTARSPRERAALRWAAAVAAALLVIAFAWLPMERARARIAAQLPPLRASVVAMRAQAAEAAAIRALPAPRAATATSLANLVASGALAQGIPGGRLTALDARRVRLTAEDASWTRLVAWLATVGPAHGLVVEEATIDALPAAGRVRADVVLAGA